MILQCGHKVRPDSLQHTQHASTKGPDSVEVWIASAESFNTSASMFGAGRDALRAKIVAPVVDDSTPFFSCLGGFSSDSKFVWCSGHLPQSS